MQYQLSEIKRVPDPEIVGILENLLEMAKKGELRGVAIAAPMVMGETFTAHALPECTHIELIGACQMTLTRLTIHQLGEFAGG